MTSHSTVVSIAASAPLGFLIGLSMGTLGGGGSILAVPALVYGAGEAPATATTTSLMAVGSIALAGMVGHLRAGRVRLASGVVFGLVGIGGSFLGSQLSRAVPDAVLLVAFSVLILVAAWRMRGRHTETPCHTREQVSATVERTGHFVADGGCQAQSPRQTRSPRDAPSAAVAAQNHARSGLATGVRVVIAGSIVGFLTGFFGVGGGFIIVPALVFALGYEMPIAVGTSLLVVALSSAEGLLFHLSGGAVDWRVAVPFTAAGLIGVLLGDAIAGRIPAASLTRWFVWLLLAVAAYTAVQSLIKL